jgi:hypothetical protein
MAHKFEHVSTGNGFSVENDGVKTQVINQDGTVVGQLTEADLTGGTGTAVFLAENDTAEGVNIAGYHDSAAPEANDVILNIRGRGNDSAGNATTFGQLGFFAIDPTDNQEAGAFFMQLAQPGDGENYGVMYVLEDGGSVNLTLGDIAGSGLQDVMLKAGQGGNGDLVIESGAFALFGGTAVAQPTSGTTTEAAFVENGGGTAVNDDSTFGGYTLQQIAQALIDLGILGS